MAEDSEEYLVERIIEYRIRKGIKQYFVKWKGFSDADNTWEPVDSLEQIKNGMEMVKKFYASSGLKSNATAKEDVVEKEPKAGPSGVKRKLSPSSSSDSSSSSGSDSSSEDDKPKTKVKMSFMKDGDNKKKSSKASKKARIASSSSSSDSESEEENRRREKKAVPKKDNPTTRSKKPEPDEDKENVQTKSARSDPETEVDLSEASTSEEDEAQMIQNELASVLPQSVKIPATTVVTSPAVQSAFRTISEEPSPSPSVPPETHSSRAKAKTKGEEASSTSSTMASVKYESLPSYPKRPFEDGYKVKEIVHVTIINMQVVFLCRFEDLPHGLLDTVELSVLRYTQPDLVIKFFQERVKLVTLDKDGKAVLDDTSKLNGIAKETTSSKPAAQVKKEDTNKEQKSQKAPSTQKKPNDDKAKLTSLGLDVSSDSEDEKISTYKSASSTIDKDKDKGKSRPGSSSKKKDNKKKGEPKKEDQRKKIAALGLEDSDDDGDWEIVEEKVGTKSKPNKKAIEKKKKKDKKVNDILDSLGLEASDSD